jgi:hypothetical protein
MTEEFTVTPELLAQRPEMAQDGWHKLSLHSIPVTTVLNFSSKCRPYTSRDRHHGWSPEVTR